MSPEGLQLAIMAVCAALLVVVPAITGVVLMVLRNARDIQAAWAQLRAHSAEIAEVKNGHDSGAVRGKPGGPVG
jgi:hypothetical protein